MDSGWNDFDDEGWEDFGDMSSQPGWLVRNVVIETKFRILHVSVSAVPNGVGSPSLNNMALRHLPMV